MLSQDDWGQLWMKCDVCRLQAIRCSDRAAGMWLRLQQMVMAPAGIGVNMTGWELVVCPRCLDKWFQQYSQTPRHCVVSFEDASPPQADVSPPQASMTTSIGGQYFRELQEQMRLLQTEDSFEPSGLKRS